MNRRRSCSIPRSWEFPIRSTRSSSLPPILSSNGRRKRTRHQPANGISRRATNRRASRRRQRSLPMAATSSRPSACPSPIRPTAASSTTPTAKLIPATASAGSPIPRPRPATLCFFSLARKYWTRLWAKWQWFNKRTLDTDPNAFFNGPAVQPGHNIGDTMWPWNGVTGGTRPDTAPGGPLPASALTSARARPPWFVV